LKKVIFVVDDSINNLTMIAEALNPHYAVKTIPTGEEAIALLEKVKPNLILLDIEMLGMDGFDVLKHLKDNHKYKDIPVIFLTAKDDFSTEIEALELGVTDFIAKPFNPAVLLNRINHHIGASELLRERILQLHKAKQDIIFVLADMIENRDEETGDHLWRTSSLIKDLLKQMLISRVYYDQISEWDFDLIAECSLLHDVGKINTPDSILNKPGKLTPEEWEIMKAHTIIGGKIIQKIIDRSGENEFLRNSKIFAEAHHERWNGSGYPYGLKGDSIPLQGRIMAIVDVYDALISKRVYKDAFSLEQALEFILEEKGKHFDPQIVDVFLDIIEQVNQDM